MAVDVRKVIQELVVPELREIRLELKTLQTEVRRLDEKGEAASARLDGKIDSFRNEMRVEVRRLDEKGEAASARFDEKLTTGLARLDEKLDATTTRLDEKLTTGLARLDEKLDAFRNEIRAEIRRLDEKLELAIQIRERLAALEAKVAGLSP